MPKAKSRRSPSISLPRRLESLIFVVRKQKVMLDSDLAVLYQVPTKSLNLAVRRNLKRFPGDFMFQLTSEEAERLRLQTETSKPGRGGGRYLPYAFTELGVAMLSSVLNSERAVEMNMAIMRAFVRLREMLASNKDFAARVEKLEHGHNKTASIIEVLVEDIDRLAHEVKQMKAIPVPPKRKIGFQLGRDE